MVPLRQSQTAFTVFLFNARNLGLTICDCETEEALFPQLLKTLGRIVQSWLKITQG